MWSILPFNLLKGAIVSTITLVMYKSVSPILHKEEVLHQSRNATPVKSER